MKIGDSVNFYDKRGDKHKASVTGVLGSGESRFKILDVRYGPDKKPVDVKSVKHQNDVDIKTDEPFWTLVGEKLRSELTTPEQAPRVVPEGVSK